MRTLIATAVIALGLLSTAAHAGGLYDDDPNWAEQAFENADS